jgi:hypothetical protein
MASANKQHNNTRELLHLYLNNCTINQHVPPDHHTLQFASGSMHLQDILHNWSHDVDDTRYYLLTTLHDLLLSMKDKNTLQTYIPAAKKPTYKRSPQTLKNAIIITSKKLMTLILQADRAHHSDDCSKIHTLADDYFNLVLEVGNFQDMKDILHKTFEYRLHWPNLKQQRQELCKHLPTWRYQLESITIFPLLYTIGWHNNTDPKSYSSLLDQCSVSHYSSIPLPFPSIKFFTDQAVAALRYKLNKSLQKTAEIVASATNTKPTDFFVHPTNDISLLIPTLFALQAPTFEEQWKNLTLDPKIPNVRKRLQTKALKDITNKETAKSKQTSAHTSVISYSGTNQTSLPINIPQYNKGAPSNDDNVSAAPPTTHHLYSDVVKENISPPLDLETLMKETLGDDYVPPTPTELVTTTNPWDNYSPLSPDPSECQDDNYVRDPLLYNAHSSNYNNTDNF